MNAISSEERELELRRILDSDAGYAETCASIARLVDPDLADYIPDAPPLPPPPLTRLEILEQEARQEALAAEEKWKAYIAERTARWNEPPDPFARPLWLLEHYPNPVTARDFAQRFVAEGYWSPEEGEALAELLLCDENLEQHKLA